MMVFSIKGCLNLNFRCIICTQSQMAFSCIFIYLIILKQANHLLPSWHMVLSSV